MKNKIKSNYMYTRIKQLYTQRIFFFKRNLIIEKKLRKKRKKEGKKEKGKL